MAGILTVFQTGKSGMNTAKSGIATAGHNISNAGTEGFSRQRVQQEAAVTKQMAGQGGPYVGEGTKLSRVERINDTYLERQLREGVRDSSYHEEKQLFLNQVEDVFNEMNGDGLNRLVARFFNDFRKLSNEPNSEAVRQAVRESSQAMVSDFRRIRSEVEQIRSHIDSRLDGNMKELNSLANQVAELNVKIHTAELQEHEANDLRDRRDLLVKRMNGMADISIHDDDMGMVNIDVRGVGPLVTGPNVEKYHWGRAPEVHDNAPNRLPAGETVSPENSLQIKRSEFADQYVTNQFRGGKIGGLVELRDRSVSQVLDRLDQLAYSVANSVNELHQKGFTADGRTNISFFKAPDTVTGAAQKFALSDEIMHSTGNIAAALQPFAPGDNRNALAIGNLQNIHVLNNGRTTIDDFYNSMVADVGVASARNKESLGQQQSIMTQLNKVREQVSGVSIDEETTNLMQYQHAFDASARVIKVADEMLDTILSLRR
jgi:flagellar hook-associated protein 1 FlgK